MEKLKNIFLTCCCSFTLVMIINCFFAINISITVWDIYKVLLTCLIISLVIHLCHIIDHILLCYVTVMSIIFLMNYIYFGIEIFQPIEILINIVLMSIVFFIVYLALYYVNEKDAKKINHMINEKREENKYE